MKFKTIKFSYDKYRNRDKKSNFDATISPYWEKQYDDMFKSWK